MKPVCTVNPSAIAQLFPQINFAFNADINTSEPIATLVPMDILGLNEFIRRTQDYSFSTFCEAPSRNKTLTKLHVKEIETSD